jgi:hypothetical protein
VYEKITPFPLLARAAAAKAASASAAPSLESSLNKKRAGVYLWKTSSMALLSNGRTFGTALVETKAAIVSAVTVVKSFLNSSKVLNKTTCPSTALLAAPSSTEATPNKTSSLVPA